MPHHHAGRVARQPLRRFRGNVGAVFEDGLARRIGVRQYRCINMHDHLVPLAWRARVDGVMERRFSDQRQGVRLLLAPGGWLVGSRFRGNAT